MIKYLLFSITALAALAYLYVFQTVTIHSYPLPRFELFAPLLFAIAGLLFLHNKNHTGAILAILALGIMARETIGIWWILFVVTKTNSPTQLASQIVLLLITITIIFFALLSIAIHALISPSLQKYSTLEQLADKPVVKKLAIIPLVAIFCISLYWVAYFLLNGPYTG